MVDVVTELARGVLNELVYADNLVMMSQTMKGLWNKFITWKEAFESVGLKVNLGNIKMMVSGGITMDGVSESKVHPCEVCSRKVKANAVLCVQNLVG